MIGYLLRGMPFNIYPTHLLADNTGAYGINASGDIVGVYSKGSDMGGFLYRSGTYTTLHVSGMMYTGAYGINASGHIVGLCQEKTPRGIKTHGFFHISGGLYATLDSPSTIFWTTAKGINALGHITGDYEDVLTGHISGFLYINGLYVPFDYPSPSVGQTS